MYPNLHRLAETATLVLGSGSPRRLELLSETGIPFERVIPAVHESPRHGEEPFPYARRLAEEKALAAYGMAIQNHGRLGLEPAASARPLVVIGCDTIVVLAGAILEKPEDEEHAFEMLTRLSGRDHMVCTSVALAGPNGLVEADFELTRVFFNQTSANQLRQYIMSGEPMDKAGAYGIQGMGSFLVDRIDGNLDTVIGLPRTLLERLAGVVISRLS